MLLSQHARQPVKTAGLLRMDMADRAQKTDEEKGDEVLRRLLKTLPDPKPGKQPVPVPQGLRHDGKMLEN